MPVRRLAPLLIDAVMLQEVDPVTEPARNGTFIVFNEIPQRNCFVTDEPFWLVEGITAAGFFTQKRREAAHTAIGNAFVSVLGEDGSSIEMGGVRIAPAPDRYRSCRERWSGLKVTAARHSAAWPA